MAISEAYASSQSVTTTEHSLPNDATYNSANVITTDGVYQIFLDTSAMADGDSFEFKLYEKVLSSSTVRVYLKEVFVGKSFDIWVSPTFILLHGWDATIIKLTGTDRNFDWSIRKVA